MKMKLFLALAAAVIGFELNATEPDGPAPATPTATPTAPANSPDDMTGNLPIVVKLADAKWNKILPELGESSPEMAILRVDPKTQATQLLIRSSKAIHIRKHWHSANETHTIISGTVKFECDGKKTDLGPGSYNFMPAKMVHEAWLPANSLTFITVDGAWDVNWTEGAPTAADLSRSY
jgi:mannose-6-phosphate isomerase-like protein (cupin superfamily)